LKQLIRAEVTIGLRDIDPLTFDWGGADGRRLVEGLMRDTYRALEDLEQ